MRVLVVDDRPDVRLSLRYMLEASGFDTAEAADGSEALDVMAREPVAVVLADYRMEGMDGVALAKQVVSQGHRRPRVILMSGSETLGPDAAAYGADAVLQKPFSREQLLTTIKATHQRA